MAQTRRTFLASALAGAASLASLGALASCTDEEDPKNPDGTEKPVEGYYSFYVTYGDMEAEVHVNAATGAVGEGLLTEIDGDETEEAVDPKEEQQQATQPQESAPATNP